MSSDNRGQAAETTMPVQYSAGFEDIIIVPLALIALALKKLWDALISLLIHLMDWAFPIILQIMRFPLFTLRILGDACAALLRGIVSIMPVSGTQARRVEARRCVRAGRGCDSKISYKAFEEALHHAFEAEWPGCSRRAKASRRARHCWCSPARCSGFPYPSAPRP